MSLNLRIGRPRPRRSRRPMAWLLAAILLAIGWLAWLQGWQPEETLAALGRDVLEQSPLAVSSLPPQLQPMVEQQLAPALAQMQEQAQPSSAESVMLVSSEVIENPQSDAYTAPLYQATGKDQIPWPNVDGRISVEIYEVQSGDSLWGIAREFGLDIDTLRWSNLELERNPDELAVGTELRILPVPGAFHIAAADETIEEIAALYGVAPDDITDYPPNALYSPYTLEAGQGLIVPYGRKGAALPPPNPSFEAALVWPIAGYVTGSFSADHPALDIGAPYGSTVYASEAGLITYSDWAADGYGYTVIVDHGDGRETWYNHLKGALLDAGAYVERGTPVGEVGSTGHSSGPHVHFEYRLNGERVDPMPYLPGSIPQ